MFHDGISNIKLTVLHNYKRTSAIWDMKSDCQKYRLNDKHINNIDIGN